jgi:hypothetical protein
MWLKPNADLTQQQGNTPLKLHPENVTDAKDVPCFKDAKVGQLMRHAMQYLLLGCSDEQLPAFIPGKTAGSSCAGGCALQLEVRQAVQ